MGVVMGAFALSSILGVPLGLELASHSGWRAPFYAVGALGVLTALVTWRRLPSMRGHLEHIERHASLASVTGLLARSEVRLAWLLTAAVMASNFLLIPNISAFIQSNLGYPREHLSRLYCIGGVASLVGMGWAGKLTDRYGATRVAAPTSVAIGAVIAAWFIPEATRLPVIVLFVLFMVTTSCRGVAYQALTSRVPGPGERASYMSVQSSIAHMACALGAFASSLILEEGSDGRLEHVNLAGWLALVMVLSTPWIYARLERALDRRTRAELDLEAKGPPELESVPPI
jgi:predicted MFS family arabinose efflux permease